MTNINLPHSPLYDPKSKILNFRFDEDFETIRMNLSGTGGLFHDTTFSYFYYEEEEWRRPKEFCTNPVFIDGKPDRFDALQGLVQNCWFLAAVEALTFHDQLIQYVVPRDQSFGQDYIGAFHFRIWQLGLWYDVVVDDRLPVLKTTKELSYAHSKKGNVFWAALLEKAYAKVCGTNQASYESLMYGKCLTSLQDLTGGLVEIRKTRGIPSDDLRWVMSEVYKSNALMVGSCDKNQDGFVDHHSYAVTSIWKTAPNDPDYHGLFLIRLMNPWGQGEWKGDWSDADYNYWRQIDGEIRNKLKVVNRDDGEFWMDEKAFARYFRYFCMCHLGPGQYLSIRDGTQNFRTWRTSSFNGEWVKGGNAFGSRLSKRHKNPQYRILLDWPQNDVNRDGNCIAIIELIQRSKQGRLKKPAIAFYVYVLSIAEDEPVPLDHKFLLKHHPIDDNPPFAEEASFVQTIKLYCPGKYCIIPCTLKRNAESQFLLRIFSESRSEIWEYDTQISKPLLKEEPGLSAFDEELKKSFNNAARGKEEIDWISLKELLDTEMNPETGFFSRIISSFTKFIGDIYQNFITIRFSSKNQDDVFFSKDECRSMVTMLDNNHSGTLNFSEFTNLWSKICFWTKVYEKHIDETEGYVTVSGLRDALSSIGYDVNKRTVNSLSYVYANEQGNICLTDFILCGVTIETVLAVREGIYEGSGDQITFTLEDWVKNTLIL